MVCGRSPVAHSLKPEARVMPSLKDELAALKIERPPESQSRPWIKWVVLLVLVAAAGAAAWQVREPPPPHRG